jgi:DNA-binding CsgD family transcriptional regulator
MLAMVNSCYASGVETTQRINTRDTRGLLAFAGELATCSGATQFDAQLTTLTELIGADAVMVSGVRGWGEEVFVETGDPELYRPELLQALGHRLLKHPVMSRDLAKADGGARRTSDFIGSREFRGWDLFSDFYRPLGVAGELTTQLSWGPAGTSCCMVLHRAGSDFSERDRAALDLLAPHLRAARSRIGAARLVSNRMQLLERGLESPGRGSVVVNRDGEIVALGKHARALLQHWTGSNTQRLPNELATWRTNARAGRAPNTLELRHGQQRLRAQLLIGEDEDLILLLDPQHESPSADRLVQVLPISHREAEVLAGLARGLTYEGIAHALSISRHTVARHIDRIYTKLEVHNRTSATRLALEVTREHH